MDMGRDRERSDRGQKGFMKERVEEREGGGGREREEKTGRKRFKERERGAVDGVRHPATGRGACQG